MWALCDTKMTLRKKILFLMEKYIEDARQDEKHVPDLLESIIQLPGLVKEELRSILFKISHFRPEITKIRVFPTLKVPKWVCRWTRAVFGSGPAFFAIFGPARGQIYGKTGDKTTKKIGC